MTPPADSGRSAASISLQLQRFIPAPPESVFDAWTAPDELRKWWGPEGVRCISAEIDLRVGGAYRIANALPDQSVVWIEGEYERIERPQLLVFSWRLGHEVSHAEKVTVRFRPVAGGTEVSVTHERVGSKALRDQHEQGWIGCLNGLERHLSTP